MLAEHTINSSWRFVQDDRMDISQIVDVKNWQLVNLPHTWNRLDAFDGVRGYAQGIGWYVKDMNVDKAEGSQVFLKFEGVNQLCEVFVNGQKAGEHVGGYTSFVVDISSFVQFGVPNRIAVKVDNRFNADIAPLSADFTFFGGIYRDVWLVQKPEVCFDLMDHSACGVYVSTPFVSHAKASLAVKANLRMLNSQNPKLIFDVKLYDHNRRLVAQSSQRIKTGKKIPLQVESNLDVVNPLLWSPDHPHLYSTEVSLRDASSGILLDQFVTKTGFRWFEMDTERAFLLNGKRLKLIGTNRHQDFEGFGNALPNQLHVKDMQLIKQMGANFVRLAHYPQDPAVMEACDRLGLVVWVEIPVVNEVTVSPIFSDNCGQMLREMIRQNYNHPSVVMWGLMNEILLRFNHGLERHANLDRKAYLGAVNQLALDLNGIAKQEDPIRWTAIAHHLNYDLYEEAGLNQITDVVGWNVYYGWYSEQMNLAGDFLDRIHVMHPSKGIIVSEYGGGSDRRIHATDPKRFDFSVEWHTQIHAAYYQQIIDRPHVMGGASWVFADFSSEGRKDAVPEMNSKGLVNYDRSLKDPYLFYQAALAKHPFLEVGSLDWRNRVGFANAQGQMEEPVYVFTNAPFIDAWVDSCHLGRFHVEGFFTRVMVPFRSGANNFKVVSADGLERSSLFNAAVYPPYFKGVSPSEIKINMNFGSHFNFKDPTTGEVWMAEQAYEKGKVGFIGGNQLLTWKGFRVGTDAPIGGTSNDPLYQTLRDSIVSIKADLPDGWYQVTLHFAEVQAPKQGDKLAYNLGADDEEQGFGSRRSFFVLANDQKVLEVSNLFDFSATNFRFRVKVDQSNGLILDFKAAKGIPFINAIAICGE